MDFEIDPVMETSITYEINKNQITRTLADEPIVKKRDEQQKPIVFGGEKHGN